MIKNIEFTQQHNGETYTVLAEYLDASPLTLEKHQASCPTDLDGEREILDVVVLDASGEETSNNFVTDEMIWFEIDVCRELYKDIDIYLRVC